MTTALALASIDGLAAKSGTIVAKNSARVQLSGADTTGWLSALWLITSYPEEFEPPEGWALDNDSGYYTYAGTSPPPFSLTQAWSGKWDIDLVVNGEIWDRSLRIEIPSPLGLHDTVFPGRVDRDGFRDFARDANRNWRKIDHEIQRVVHHGWAGRVPAITAPEISRVATATFVADANGPYWGAPTATPGTGGYLQRWEFNSDSEWVVPDSGNRFRVLVFGPGGGGGGGMTNIGVSGATGGAGGGGGACRIQWFSRAELLAMQASFGSSIPVTIGLGGNGGAGSVVSGAGLPTTNGSPGSGPSSFGNVLAYAGGGCIPGISTAGGPRCGGGGGGWTGNGADGETGTPNGGGPYFPISAVQSVDNTGFGGGSGGSTGSVPTAPIARRGGHAIWGGGGGGAASNADGAAGAMPGGASLYGAGGGGNGGSRSSGGGPAAPGGAGGASGDPSVQYGGGGAGGSGGSSAGHGTNGANGDGGTRAGAGGGGGGSTDNADNGGNGGHGGFPGGGGGGGGSRRHNNGGVAGNGGSGANGWVVVESYS